ncbi:MAG: PAS domain-containing protein, partial [Chloroflexota bacterium]|nr:PAS domain-containing protein [Chloroflexota bacterium]
VGAALAERGESGEVLRRCTEAIVRHLHAARATIWLLDEAGEALELAASAGPFSDPRVDGRVPIGRFRVGHVAQERVPCVTNDLAADHQEGDKDWASRAGLTSFAGYPLLLEDRLVGVVALFAPEPLADDTLTALGTVADVLAQGIERRRAEARFRALVENSADIVTLVDADGIVLFQSPAVASILGYRPKERVGQDAFALMHPDDGPRVRAWFAELATVPERRSRVEFRARHRDGSWRWFEAAGASLADDPGARGFLVQSRDVTERKRAEEALRRSEASLAEAQRLAHLGSWELDLATGEGRWSDESYRIFGIPPGEGPLTQQRYLTLVHPDDRGRVAAEIDERTARGAALETEYRIVRPDGSVRFLHLQGEVVRNDAGRPVRLLGTNQDVTERREAEERLREAEAKYRSLVERLPAVVYSERLLNGDSAAFPRYVAPQIADLLGYSQAEWLADPALWAKRLHPDDRPAVFAAYERAERGGVPYHGEYRLLARGGRVVWVRDDAVLLRDAAGRPRGWQGVMLDVTDCREAEARLREAEVRYKALVESLPAIVSTQPADGGALTSTYVSPQVETILGYSPDEILTSPVSWIDRVHPDDRERVRAELARVNATGEPFRAEYRRRTRDGRWVWLRDEAVLVPGANGHPGYWLSVQFDVTEGKAAEEALHRSEARFRALIQNGSDVVSVLAADGTVGYQSPALGRVLGYAPEELEGRSVFAFVHPEDAPHVADAFAALAGDPAGRTVVELRFRHKDGSWRALEALGVNLLADPAVAGIVVNSRDVTERRRDEAEIAQALAAQQAANAELERLNRVKSDFVSVVSHEFRTPLTSIQGFSELIRDEELPPEEVREFADDINRNARRLARLTGEMLDLDRLRSGRLPLRREPVDLNAVVAEVVDTLRPAAPRHAFALDLDPSLPPLIGDRDRLGQVVTNLLDNAVKYAPGGGEIAVASRRDGDVVHLKVRDQGVGIPPQALETVFEWYARVESGADAPGTGLGLPITREIVERHGGGIWAESEPGHGTTFHVVLPLAGAPESPESGNGPGRRWRAWFSARTAGSR